jgi:D-alanine-D-alanine ligase
VTLSILFGGQSYEHEISIVSAITLKSILTCKLQFIFCDGKRRFYHIPNESMKANHFASGNYRKNPRLYLEEGGFVSQGFLGKTKQLLSGSILNLIHGADGEDGKIASMLDFYNIPYIGPRVEASVLSYSKVLTKDLAAHAGVKTLPCDVLTQKNRKLSTLDFPVILKPAHLGSSIGVSIVRDEETLDYALDVALAFDEIVIAEPFMEGVLEYNLAGCKTSNGMEFSIVEAPQKGELLDFDKKYLDFSRSGKVEEAKITNELQNALKRAFSSLYEPIFEGALVRCDFFVIDGEVILNEINPSPGSLAHYLFSDFDSLVGRLNGALPKPHKITVEYNYINTIHSAKGKASYR